jgi:hypothetical protein
MLIKSLCPLININRILIYNIFKEDTLRHASHITLYSKGTLFKWTIELKKCLYRNFRHESSVTISHRIENFTLFISRHYSVCDINDTLFSILFFQYLSFKWIIFFLNSSFNESHKYKSIASVQIWRRRIFLLINVFL